MQITLSVSTLSDWLQKDANVQTNSSTAMPHCNIPHCVDRYQ